MSSITKTVTSSNDKKKPDEQKKTFNGNDAFVSLKTSLQGNIETINTICISLLQNWERLLQFNYNTNEKDGTLLIALTYIIQTILSIINDKYKYYLSNSEPLQQLIIIVPKIASLNIIDNLLEKDKRRSRQTFIQLLDIINKSSDLKRYIRKKSSLSVVHYYEIILYAILDVANKAAMYSVFETNDLKQFTSIFDSFKIYLTTYFNDNTKLDQLPSVCFELQSNHKICISILSLIWTLADKTKLVPLFISCGCPKSVLDWIQLSHLRFEHKRPLISIIHNLARNPQGQSTFRKIDENGILDKIRPAIENYKDNDINVIYYMGYTLIYGHELLELSLKELRNQETHYYKVAVIKHIFEYNINACYTSIEHKQMSFNGFHLSELLVVLEKLFISDYIVQYCLELGFSLQSEPINYISLFSNTLLSIYGAITDGDERGKLACESIIYIIWSLTFFADKEIADQLKTIKGQLKSNGNLLIVLHRLTETDHTTTEAVKCILHNLDELPLTSVIKNLISFNKPVLSFSYTIQDKLFV
ncbi:unnamed protein product, partial [Didymodactylos carnosus]